MLSKNAFTYSNWDITEYPCRLQDMSRFQGVHIKGFYCTCLQFNVLHGSCAEGLHFSALVYVVIISTIDISRVDKDCSTKVSSVIYVVITDTRDIA